MSYRFMDDASLWPEPSIPQEGLAKYQDRVYAEMLNGVVVRATARVDPETGLANFKMAQVMPEDPWRVFGRAEARRMLVALNILECVEDRGSHRPSDWRVNAHKAVTADDVRRLRAIHKRPAKQAATNATTK